MAQILHIVTKEKNLFKIMIGVNLKEYVTEIKKPAVEWHHVTCYYLLDNIDASETFTWLYAI